MEPNANGDRDFSRSPLSSTTGRWSGPVLPAGRRLEPPSGARSSWAAALHRLRDDQAAVRSHPLALPSARGGWRDWYLSVRRPEGLGRAPVPSRLGTAPGTASHRRRAAPDGPPRRKDLPWANRSVLASGSALDTKSPAPPSADSITGLPALPIPFRTALPRSRKRIRRCPSDRSDSPTFKVRV